MKTKEKGFLAEELACEFLKKQGYQIIKRNWKFKNFGEIDLIAQKKNLLNFVEVKSLFNQKNFDPEGHFSSKKLKKIAKLASFFANKNKFDHWIISLLTISFEEKEVKINYYENLKV